MHCILNNPVKYFTENWKDGNTPVFCYNLLTIFSLIGSTFAFFQSYENILSSIVFKNSR